MKNILALDLGTKMGWVLYGNGVEMSGVKDFSSKRFEGAGMRYLNLRRWLDKMHKDGDIKEIYFEEVNHSGWRNSSAVYGGFLATLSTWCEENEIPYMGVPVKTIKKFITGNGNAKKEDVISAIKKKGYMIENDNEADAMALSLYVRDKINMDFLKLSPWFPLP